MKTSTAQNVLFDAADPIASEAAAPAPPGSTSPCYDDDGLPPPTKAQLFYWRQLAGAVHEYGTAGLPDGEWPVDLTPQPNTLQALVERHILVRRGRAWHLRRHWYARLTALRLRAVDTPPLTLTTRPAPDLPTYAELEAWEHLCRWLDGQPKQRAMLPFLSVVRALPGMRVMGNGGSDGAGGAAGEEYEVGDVGEREQALTDERRRHLLVEQAAQLRAMRRYRLVRHLSTCEWALSPKWREKLRALWQGANLALREYSPPQLASATACSLCAGLDTWGLNWLVEEKALPARLRRDLDDLQQQAQADEHEVATPWLYDGAPLRLYQTGVRAKNGKGVSWSYVLINPSLRLLIRRVPLGGIVANARLGSECLWRRTPGAALNELHALIRKLWGRDVGRWQVSYAHLAHDVANAPLERDQLDRYVSRSRRRAIYDAAKVEMQRMLRETRPGHTGHAEFDEDLLLELGCDWETEYADDEELLLADAFAEDGDEWEATPRGSTAGREALEEDVEQRACHAHVWGTRLSGVAFSPGGAVSCVMYRKDWEGRLKNKQHMEPLWKAAGWDGRAPVTRHEARLIRAPIRELHLQGVAAPVLDDPWQFLEHQQDVWGAIVGRAQMCPDAVDVAWIRRVVPKDGESNRSRWDTDPVWRVVQQASFTPSPLAARRMIRRQQRQHDVKKLNQQLLGVLKKREAVLHPDPSGRDISQALRDVVVPLERELAARGEQFDQAVRRKRQACGLAVTMAGTVLPFRAVREPVAIEAEQQRVAELEELLSEVSAGGGADPGSAGGRARAQNEASREARDQRGSRWQTWAWQRTRSVEVRMGEAYRAVEDAEMRGATERELERLAAIFAREVQAYEAVRARLAMLGATAGQAPHPDGHLPRRE